MLPQTLRSLGWLSPVTWLRELTAWTAGYDAEPRAMILMTFATVLLAAGAAVLYARRLEKTEGAE